MLLHPEDGPLDEAPALGRPLVEEPEAMQPVVASSHCLRRGDAFSVDQALSILADGIGAMPLLGLRLAFKTADGAPLCLPDSVWRGVIKHRLPGDVRSRLMPDAAVGPAVTAPGLVIGHSATGVQLTFFGAAALDAEAVLAVLVAAGLCVPAPNAMSNAGLGKHGAVAALDDLLVLRAGGQWHPCPLPLRRGDLAQRAIALEGCWPETPGPVGRGLVWMESPCLLKQAGEPPSLKGLLRALWPRMLGTWQRWRLLESQKVQPDWTMLKDALGRALANGTDERCGLDVQLVEANWRSQTHHMRSGRQGTQWAKEAFCGLLVYEGIPADAWRVLELGQAFGLGQGSTVGMGRYSCQRLHASPLA